jgi:large subunit ribosomal protein L25
MMSELHIKANKRESVGKSHARRLRRLGDIPCTLYGAEEKSVSLSVSRHEFEKLLTETRSVFVVDVDGAEQRAVVKDIQYHPVKGLMIHVDFMRVKAGQEINVSVPIKFTGTAEGEKMGGVFQEIKSELDITCLPKNMPDSLEIEISQLDVGDVIRVSDLNFENITINAEENALICTVAIPRKIEEEAEVEGEEEEIEEEEGAEPEVITAKKKEDGEESEED